MRLEEIYKQKTIKELMEKFGYKTPMQVPRIEKVVVNCGFGREIIPKTGQEREKYLQRVEQILSQITGQKPVLMKARKSIASFKVRKGAIVGAKVTLRGKKMYGFLEKLLWITLPRSRDFRGISLKSLDKNGNLSIGFKEYAPFPEPVVEREKGVFGLEVTVVTTAKTRSESEALLRSMGFPLQKG